MNGLEAYLKNIGNGEGVISPIGERCFNKNFMLYYLEQPSLPVSREALAQDGWLMWTPLTSLRDAMNESDLEMVGYFQKDNGDMRMYSFSDHITPSMAIEKSWRPIKKEYFNIERINHERT